MNHRPIPRKEFFVHPSTFSLFVVTVAVGTFLFFFGDEPGFRDGAHFYGPLFEYLAQETAAGRLPLWNPYENLGQPLAANPTTLFFYPPTLLVLGISCVGVLDIGSLYTIFTGFHLFLALFTSYRLARHWRCSREAASFAALAYALGGNVLFQWNNIPFLIGAAWFPELLRQGDRLICHGRTRHLIGLAVVAALTILGGDPQAVYHAAICLLVLLAFRHRARYRDSRTTARSLRQLVLAGFFTLLLAGIQILPAMELGIHSDRQLETHRTWMHAFSVPPWRLLEFLWPNAGGRQFPENARWVSAFNFERGIWTPSLYMGLLPAVLAVLTLSRIRLLRSRQWSAAVVLLFVFLLGALGDGFVVYPMLERLPGYVMFRYPGKLMTVASLLIALLAARGFDVMERSPTFFRRFRFVLSFYAVPIGIASAMAISGANCFPEVPACPLFGPFNVEKARFVLGFSAVSVFLVVSSVFCFSRRHGAHGGVDCGANSSVSPCLRERKYFTGILLLVAALDVCAANAWMLATLPNEVKPLSPTIETAAPTRIYRYPVWYPPSFGKTSSANRIAEAAEWDRQTLFPRYSLPRRISVVDVRGTLMTKTWHPEAGKLRQGLRSGKSGEFENHLARLGVRYVIAPGDVRLDADRIVPDGDVPEDATFWKIHGSGPRKFVRYEPNRIVFDVSLAQPETVVIAEQFWPGWRAFLDDGQKIPIHAVDEVFRGINLPAGTHRVTMVYDPLSLKLGAAMTLCGVVGLLLLVLKSYARNRQNGILAFPSPAGRGLG